MERDSVVVKLIGSAAVIAGLYYWYKAANNAWDIPSDLVEKIVKLVRDYKNDQLISEDLIKKRVREIRIEALNVHAYKCIKDWYFLLIRIKFNPYYKDIIKDAENKLYLDLGCCFGIEMRQLIVDGAKLQNIIGVDIENSFIEGGFAIFNDKDKLGDRFITTNFLYNSFIDFILKKFGGPVDVIYAGSIIHLLTENESAKLLSTAFALLKDGGILLGQTAGASHAGKPSTLLHGPRYLHSHDSLINLFKETGFVDINVNEQHNDEFTRGTTQRWGWRFFSFACKKYFT